MHDFRRTQEARKFFNDSNIIIPWDSSERSIAIAIRRLNKAMSFQRTVIKRKRECVTQAAYHRLKREKAAQRKWKMNGMMNRPNAND